VTFRFDLRTARLNRGLSLRQAASEIGVPEQTIRRLERGLGATPSNAKLVADFFDITVVDLLPLDAPEEAAA
jgi:transcriptional regulator with XRE-family HTH domain